MKNDFSDVKINDEVFHLRYGKCIVSATPRRESDYFNITCTDELGKFDIRLTVTGRMNKSDLNPSVFWDEVKIIPPTKPKRKIEKTVEGWLNIYPNDTCYKDINARSYDLYKSSELADKNANKEKRLGEACYIIHKYTIEE